MHSRTAILAAALFTVLAPLRAETLFFSGDLRNNASVVDCGSGCTLGALNSDGEYAQWAAFIAPFTLASDSTVRAMTFGFGGGVSGTGAVVAPGGLEPYLSLFDGAGNFLSSTFAGTTCPAGANSLSGQCLDVLLDAGTLLAGNYQIALTAWQNLSFAENLGSGTLADGFTGLGNLSGRENLNFAFDVVIAPVLVTPEPGTGGTLLLTALLLTAGIKKDKKA
jgi:hypothetical protein